MRVNDIIKFWVDTDDSDYASNCHGADQMNDWLSVQYYPEQIKGIIIWKSKNIILAQKLYKSRGSDIEQRGEVYNISKKGIANRIKNVKKKISFYRISKDDFFQPDYGNESDYNIFYKVELMR